MPDEPHIKYTRLASTQFATFRRQSLWLGPDHLLCVEHSSFSERYYRFYFHEIQSLQFQRTSFHSVLAWILGVVCAMAAVAVFSQVSLFLTVPGLVVLVPGSFLLVVHLVQGATCACTVRTAVQQRRLNCLGRVRTTERVLAQVRQLVMEAQIDLPPVEEAIAALPEHSVTAPTARGVPAPTHVKGVREWSLVAGGTFLLQALCGGVVLLGIGEMIYGFVFLVLVALAISLIAAVMHHRAGESGSDLVLALSWTGAGCQMLLGVIGYGAFISWFLSSGVKRAGMGIEGQMAVFDFLLYLAQGGPGWLKAILPALVALVAILGVGILAGAVFGMHGGRAVKERIPAEHEADAPAEPLEESNTSG
ncbi:MAG: hypothetical protein KAI66_00735 [Lentisphaeria bacterium]|nr:hypothetical protein [Lentisphaeria bacterium]